MRAGDAFKKTDTLIRGSQTLQDRKCLIIQDFWTQAPAAHLVLLGFFEYVRTAVAEAKLAYKRPVFDRPFFIAKKGWQFSLLPALLKHQNFCLKPYDAH